MYQEIRADSLDPIVRAIESALSTDSPVSITLKKRGADYEATLIQVAKQDRDALPFS